MHAVDQPIPSVSFDDVVALGRDDMQAVDALIRESLRSDVELVSQVSEYIVMSGGKRLRPMIVLLAAPEGIDAVEESGLVDRVVTAAIDSHLNEVGFIVPGLGDAGDRQYGVD